MYSKIVLKILTGWAVFSTVNTILMSKRANSWLVIDVWVLWRQEKQSTVTVFPILSADAISSGDDEDDTDRSDDVGVDGEQMREYQDRGPNTSCHSIYDVEFRCNTVSQATFLRSIRGLSVNYLLRDVFWIGLCSENGKRERPEVH